MPRHSCARGPPSGPRGSESASRGPGRQGARGGCRSCCCARRAGSGSDLIRPARARRENPAFSPPPRLQVAAHSPPGRRGLPRPWRAWSRALMQAGLRAADQHQGRSVADGGPGPSGSGGKRAGYAGERRLRAGAARFPSANAPHGGPAPPPPPAATPAPWHKSALPLLPPPRTHTLDPTPPNLGPSPASSAPPPWSARDTHRSKQQRPPEPPARSCTSPGPEPFLALKMPIETSMGAAGRLPTGDFTDLKWPPAAGPGAGKSAALFPCVHPRLVTRGDAAAGDRSQARGPR